MFKKENVKEVTGEVPVSAYTRYTGILPVQVACINPDKKGLEKLFPGRDITEEPSYVLEKEGMRGTRVCIYYKTNPLLDSTRDMELVFNGNYYLWDAKRVSKNGLKTEHVNEYGESRWLTSDEVTGELVTGGKSIPFLPPYRAAYQGEVSLLRFVRTFLSVESCAIYKNSEWVLKEDARLPSCKGWFTVDEMKKMLAGNLSPLREVIAMAPDNHVKILLGIKTTDNGKQYQAVHERVLHASSTSVTALTRDIENERAAGYVSGIEWGKPPYLFTAIENTPTEFKKDEPVAGTVFEGDDGLPF
jgi:hypothetical protein